MLEFPGFLGEDLDEFLADYLALRFGIAHAFQFFVEVLGGPGDGQVEAQVLLEHFLNLLGFMVAEKAVVNEDAVEFFADGFVEKHGGHGGIHAAGKA